MERLLRDCTDVVAELSFMVLQPMTDGDVVRRCLRALGWRPENEWLVDEGHLYEIILARPGTLSYPVWQEFTGPILWAKRDPLLIKKIARLLRLQEQELTGLKRARSTPEHRRKIEKLAAEMVEWEERLCQLQFGLL